MRRAEKRAAWIVLVGSACGVLLLDPVSPTTAFAAVAGLGAVGYGLWRSGWIGSRHRIVTVSWQGDGRWLLADREHTFHGELAAGSRLFGTALWLGWKIRPHRWRSMLLTVGDLAPEQLRELAVRLRIEASGRAVPETDTR
jgi:hypothetical protein